VFTPGTSFTGAENAPSGPGVTGTPFTVTVARATLSDARPSTTCVAAATRERERGDQRDLGAGERVLGGMGGGGDLRLAAALDERLRQLDGATGGDRPAPGREEAVVAVERDAVGQRGEGDRAERVAQAALGQRGVRLDLHDAARGRERADLVVLLEGPEAGLAGEAVARGRRAVPGLELVVLVEQPQPVRGAVRRLVAVGDRRAGAAGVLADRAHHAHPRVGERPAARAGDGADGRAAVPEAALQDLGLPQAARARRVEARSSTAIGPKPGRARPRPSSSLARPKAS
jgi:hypothetical protein